MVRRPWLRRTRLLAGAPTASASLADNPRDPFRGEPAAEEAEVDREEPFAAAVLLLPVARSRSFVTVAASDCTPGDPMAREC
jgi:hypothetical protein